MLETYEKRDCNGTSLLKLCITRMEELGFMKNKSFNPIVLAGLLLVSASLSGCAQEVNPEQAYKHCMARIMKEIDKRRKQKGPSQMTNDYKEFIADEQCRPGIEACVEDLKSFSCKDFLKKYKRLK